MIYFPPIDTSTALSGQIVIATAGTAQQGPSASLPNGVYIKALSGNNDLVYVGTDGTGDVTDANGFELSPGDMVIVQVKNLDQLWFDAAQNGDGFCWIKA